MPPVRAFGPFYWGLSPNQGHSPSHSFLSLTAGRSPASHQAAKPERRGSNLRRQLLTSGGEAGTKRVKSSKTAPHIGRRSRNEEGQIFEDSSSHRAAKPERIEPNLSKDRHGVEVI